MVHFDRARGIVERFIVHPFGSLDYQGLAEFFCA